MPAESAEALVPKERPMSACLARSRRPAAVAVVLAVAASPAAADPSGLWITAKATVRISPCGEALCGTVVSLKEPNDAAGAPKLDAANADASKRSRPIVGVAILSDMKRDGGGWRGRIYNPEDGRTYAATMAERGETLDVQGCALGGLVCKTQVWRRGG
jgi:uncharacterized protein (DUF2147 family)